MASVLDKELNHLSSRHLKLQVYFFIGQTMQKIIYFQELLNSSNEPMYVKVQSSSVIKELLHFLAGENVYTTLSLNDYYYFQFN